MVSDAGQHLLHLAAGPDQRPGMFRRLDLLELNQAGTGHSIDRFARGIGDEMEMEAPVIFAQRHGDSPVDDSVEQTSVVPREWPDPGFCPGLPTPAVASIRSGIDSRAFFPIAGTTPIATSSSPSSPLFPWRIAAVQPAYPQNAGPCRSMVYISRRFRGRAL